MHYVINFHNNPTKWVLFIPIVQVTKLRLRVVKLHLQGHTGSKAEKESQICTHFSPQYEAS